MKHKRCHLLSHEPGRLPNIAGRSINLHKTEMGFNKPQSSSSIWTEPTTCVARHVWHYMSSTAPCWTAAPRSQELLEISEALDGQRDSPVSAAWPWPQTTRGRLKLKRRTRMSWAVQGRGVNSVERKSMGLALLGLPLVNQAYINDFCAQTACFNGWGHG